MQINIQTDGLTPELREAIDTLNHHYPLTATDDTAVPVTFEQVTEDRRVLRFERSGNAITVQHADLACALRGLGALLGAASPDDLQNETGAFRTLGIMLDVSRNAVMKVEHFKRWLERLALLGYNMAMLYTEDTYELPGEPYFGYMRGAYTPDELREVDQYAQKLGIEMIPCIQTLGHLEQIFRWPVYRDIRDQGSVLLADEERSYALIQKMLDRWAEVFQSRRIHIGMDEAHGVGRGNYLKRHGYRDAFEIINEHLQRVVGMCMDMGYAPMMWSDMYFRLGSPGGGYYEPETVIPEHARDTIPEDVQLVYWDYYHREASFYQEWIRRHRDDLKHEPIVATGAWAWKQTWYSTTRTELQAGPAVRGSRNAGVDELFVTIWGDDGAMCDFDSAQAGLAFIAELSYREEADPAQIGPRFKAVCGSDYEAHRLGGLLPVYEHESGEGDEPRKLDTWAVLWDDPLLGQVWRNEKQFDPTIWPAARDHLANIRDGLAHFTDEDGDAGNLAQAQRLADWLVRKIELREKLDEAYEKRDMSALREVAQEAEAIIELCQKYGDTLRAQWLARHKPFGLEVVQIRIAGHIERWRELIRRLDALCSGQSDHIAELDVPAVEPLPAMPGAFRAVAKGSASSI